MRFYATQSNTEDGFPTKEKKMGSNMRKFIANFMNQYDDRLPVPGVESPMTEKINRD